MHAPKYTRRHSITNTQHMQADPHTHTHTYAGIPFDAVICHDKIVEYRALISLSLSLKQIHLQKHTHLHRRTQTLVHTLPISLSADMPRDSFFVPSLK